MYFLGGLTGVYISTIILFIILILSIYFVNNKLNKNTFIAFLVSLICVVGLTNFVAARAQLLTYILFVWEFYLINKFLETGKKKYGIFILLISDIFLKISGIVKSYPLKNKSSFIFNNVPKSKIPFNF